MSDPRGPLYSNGNSRPDAPSVLDGIRVLDLASVVAGPVCAGILGEFGAEVIKVEDPGTGDALRAVLPQAEGLGLWWAVEGRNKRSITLNLRVPEGQELAKKLIAVSDVLIENFRPGTLAKWNLGYDQIKQVNPRIILTSISGFGQTGPYRRKPAYDPIAVAMGGWAYVMGDPDRPPARPTMVLADYGTAFTSAIGTLLALYHRDARGGSGQQIDASLVDTALRVTERLLPMYDRLGIVRERQGNRYPGSAPSDHFATRDGGWISLSAGSNRMFGRLTKAMGRPDLAADPRFALVQDRTGHSGLIHQIVADWVLQYDRDDLVRLLEEHEVPVAPIYTAADIVRDPHYLEREMVVEVEDPTIGSVKMPGVTPKLSETPGRIIRGAPALGEGNRDIYCGLLGLNEADLDRLQAAGVI